MVFLGLLFPRWKENSIKEKSRTGSIQNQVNTFQWNCIDGLYENLQSGIRIINALPVGTFPFQYKDLLLRSKEWEYHNEIHYQVGSINLPFLKQFLRYKKIKGLLKKNEDKQICIYSMYLPFLKAVQKLDKSYHVQLIVPDLPEYYDYSGKASMIRRFLRKQNNKAIYKCLKRVDSFVLLTEHMKEPLEIGSRPYTIVEGISNYVHNVEQKECFVEEEDKKVILYTGTLHKKFGIDVLMEAFSLIKDANYELWICGSGDYEEQIKHLAVQDSRIKFFGYVSKDKSDKMLKAATVVVNPRQNNGEYTKYSFPSKTMEYLSSGKPVIAYKLDGIPGEYDEYIAYVEGDSAIDLAQKLQSCCELPRAVRESIGLKAQTFIADKKNMKAQTKKMINIL